MDEQQTYEWIEQYLAGELQGDALQEFEARLATDSGFAAEVEVHRGVQAALGDAEAMQFSELLTAADTAYFEDGQANTDDNAPEVVRQFWRQPYTIAAAILVLAMVGAFFVLQNTGKPSASELYASYFTVYDATTEWRAGDPVIDAELKSAFDAYNAKNFDAAGKAFAAIEAKDSTDATARFYLAMSAMAVDDQARAVPRLEALLAESGHPYRSQSRWYLAMAHLQAGKVEAAKPLLEDLAAGAGKFKKLAVEILDKL